MHLISQHGPDVLERDDAPPWVWPLMSTWTKKHSQYSHTKKPQTLPPFLPPLCWTLYILSSPPRVSKQRVDAGNTSHGWPYKAVRKLLISSFRAQIATPPLLSPWLQSPLPLLLPASCLYQLIFHTGERPVPLAQKAYSSTNVEDNTLSMLSCFL